MERELDVRGLRCPVPYVRARARIAALAPGDRLVVLATDPEAPLDLAALATDENLSCAIDRSADGVWRIALARPEAHGGATAPARGARRRARR